ncbi:hypothetical protein KAT55_05730, partial [Candidatus Bathyarchaeota archaeon]|nr:hypothetical protein [Candidatus Bathyarchaeota archaeon]
MDRLTELSGLRKWLPITVAVIAIAAILLPRYLPRDGQEVPQHTLTLEECGGTLTILYDNNPFEESCMTEWGFSCLVELEDKTILFDTG